MEARTTEKHWVQTHGELVANLPETEPVDTKRCISLYFTIFHILKEKTEVLSRDLHHKEYLLTLYLGLPLGFMLLILFGRRETEGSVF